jgi:hypothetical protein
MGLESNPDSVCLTQLDRYIQQSQLLVLAHSTSIVSQFKHTEAAYHKRNEEPSPSSDQLEDMVEGGAHEEESKQDSTAHAGVIAIESKDWFLMGAG